MGNTNDAYKPLWVLFFIILGVTAVTAISTRVRAGEDKIPWRTDVAAAEAEAKAAGKPVLLYFTASWCGPCQQMRGATWGDAAVDAKLRSAYVPVKIDIDANRETAVAYEIDGVPTMVVLDADGKVERRTTGFVDAGEFLNWLEGRGPM